VQADPDGPSSSDEPRLKRLKPSAAEEEGAQQAPASEGHPTAVEEEAKRQVAGGGEEQGEEAAFMAAEPVSMPNVEAAPVVDSEAALPGADLTGHGAAEPACLVASRAEEEEAKEATGLTPIVDQMVKCTVRQGRPLCTEARLNGAVDEVCLQACATLVRLTHTLFVKLVFATVH